MGTLRSIGEQVPQTGAAVTGHRGPGMRLFAVETAAATNTATGDKLRIYVDEIGSAEMREWIGWKKIDGTLVDGVLTNFFQALAAGRDLDSSSAVSAVDTDSGSPNYGRVYLSLTFL